MIAQTQSYRTNSDESTKIRAARQVSGTWEFWKGFDWSFTDELKRREYRSYDTTTCGMHIHVSKSALSELDQFKLLKFFRDNSPLITRLSRRRDGALERWARIDSGSTGDFIEKIKGQPGERYQAINMVPRHTVEFRIFRGTLDSKAILRNLSLVVALVKFCKWAGLHQLTEGHFIGWLSLHGECIGKKESRTLLDWIKGNNVAVEQAA